MKKWTWITEGKFSDFRWLVLVDEDGNKENITFWAVLLVIWCIIL